MAQIFWMVLILSFFTIILACIYSPLFLAL